MNKKGSTLRSVFAIIGAILFLLGIYFLNEQNILYAGIAGITGLLTIIISVFPFVKGRIKQK